jgi:hypothetical protein
MVGGKESGKEAAERNDMARGELQGIGAVYTGV